MSWIRVVLLLSSATRWVFPVCFRGDDIFLLSFSMHNGFIVDIVLYKPNTFKMTEPNQKSRRDSTENSREHLADNTGLNLKIVYDAMHSTIDHIHREYIQSLQPFEKLNVTISFPKSLSTNECRSFKDAETQTTANSCDDPQGPSNGETEQLSTEKQKNLTGEEDSKPDEGESQIRKRSTAASVIRRDEQNEGKSKLERENEGNYEMNNESQRAGGKKETLSNSADSEEGRRESASSGENTEAVPTTMTTNAQTATRTARCGDGSEDGHEIKSNTTNGGKDEIKDENISKNGDECVKDNEIANESNQTAEGVNGSNDGCLQNANDVSGEQKVDEDVKDRLLVDKQTQCYLAVEIVCVLEGDEVATGGKGPTASIVQQLRQMPPKQMSSSHSTIDDVDLKEKENAKKSVRKLRKTVRRHRRNCWKTLEEAEANMAQCQKQPLSDTEF